MINTPAYAQTPQIWGKALLNSLGAYTFAPGATLTNLVQLFAAGPSGSKVEAINVSSTDSAAQTLLLILYDGTALNILGAAPIPIAAGTNGTAPSVNALNNSLITGLPTDSNGNKYLYLPSGSSLYCGTPVIVTSGKQLSVVANGVNF